MGGVPNTKEMLMVLMLQFFWCSLTSSSRILPMVFSKKGSLQGWAGRQMQHEVGQHRLWVGIGRGMHAEQARQDLGRSKQAACRLVLITCRAETAKGRLGRDRSSRQKQQAALTMRST
jgi:hypothetical protein